MSGRRGLLLVTALLVLVAPALVAAAVWAPTVARNLVPEVAVADPVVQEARDAPSDAILEELGGFDLLPLAGLDRQQRIGSQTAPAGPARAPGPADVEHRVAVLPGRPRGCPREPTAVVCGVWRP